MYKSTTKTYKRLQHYEFACFCDSETTLKYAHKLGRKWIGIDQSELAIDATENKLSKIAKDLFIRQVRI